MSLRHRQLLAAAAAVLSLSAAAAEMQSVAITAIVDHPALDAARKGITDELKAAGYGDDKLKVQYQSAQGNPATAGQIARKFVGDKPNVAVAIATPSAQALVAASKTLPIVFTAVTDPVAAKLVSSWKASGSNVTGVSDMLPLGPQVDLILKVKPAAKRIGMVYSPGEVNSTIVAKELKAELAKRGMTLVEAPAARTVDVAPAAKSLIGKVDAIYTSTDNNVVSTYESLVAVANQAKLPLIASDTDSVKRGAIAALGMNYYDMGRQTGKIVIRILKGEKPGTIAPEVGSKLSLTVNPAAAIKQGAPLSATLLKEAQNTVK
ncbi:ABC transporter substrate-binding protein [Aquitalea palustris]|uniref:ABC transporter substrate-binding protein n=1 Tax=Aquitalea palustris TaxID=2480983 RepID=A0A454JMD3_9NEIS|nr:ABC transporter substrate-binding protein [Aquitalea palustris]RMD01176.1 ABC transporter substrate-binding protein [Aquitalea palustris]